VKRELRAALAAVTFLTRLPLAGRVELDGDDVGRSGAYFPLVGAVLGAASAVVADRFGPELGVTGGAVATGALHLDAVADIADGCGGRTRERALEIMSDPRIGAFGATAIVCDLLLRRAALAALTERRDTVRAGIAAGALSRAVPVLLAAALPYARADGTGAALSRSSRPRAGAAAVLAVALAVASHGAAGARMAVGAGGLTIAAAVILNRWLGGVTGDALGASLELTETTLLVAVAAR
jgi:adenosylcobinamide-GDP ribazoletransferase